MTSAVRRLTALRLTYEDLVTHKAVLEKRLSNCGRPISSPTYPSTALSSSAPWNSTTRSAFTGLGSRYPPIPERSSSLQTSFSSFSSTPCPWKDNGFQQSLEGSASNDTTISVVFPQRKKSQLCLGQTLKRQEVHHWEDSAFKSIKLPPLSPSPLNPRPRPKHSGIELYPRERETAVTPKSNQETELETLKPSYREPGRAGTSYSHQEIVMEIAMVDVEIELVMMREWMLRLTEKEKRDRITSKAQVEGEKERGDLVQRQQVENGNTQARNLEIGKFF